MKKETSKQMTSKIQEVKEMTSQNIPYSNQALLKWSALKVVRSEDKQRPYKLIKTSLVELVKSAEYSQFRDRFNWLYRNYNPENYQLVWNELQEFNARRIQKCFQDNAIEIADAKMQETIDSVVAHFGEMPAWIKNLHKGFELHFNCGLKSDTNPYYDTGLYLEDATLDTRQAFSMIKTFVKSKGVNLPDRKIWRRTKIVDVRQQTKAKRELLLDRAKTCYGLVPEYDNCTVVSKQLYNVPERYIKDDTVYKDSYMEKSDTPVKVFGTGKTQRTVKYHNVHHIDGKENNPIDYYYNIIHSTETVMQYYDTEELHKAGITPGHYQTLVGKVKVTVEHLKRLAEDAVIRDARWMSQHNDTEYDLREHREVEDNTDFEERIQQAIEFIEKHRNEYAPDELLQTVLYLYNIKPTECNKNTMVPITDMQGPDTPYGLDVEFRDFLEPVYEDGEGL